MAVKRNNGDVAETVEAAASIEAPVAKTFEATVAAVKEQVSGAVATFEKTQADIKTNVEKAVKTAEEFVAFGQGNLEAVVKSGQIWAAGVQDISKALAATAQAQLDETVATFKALATVKSLKEAVDLQSSLARSSLEKAVAEAGKLTDASLKLTEQTIAPLTARVTLAVEKFGRAA
jgi:phasin family protein